MKKKEELMISQEHEDIIDEVRNIVFNEFAQIWEPTFGGIGVNGSYLLGYINEHKRPPEPDMVIIPQDGAGAIAVEVGKMPDGKWREVIARDGKSVRVLRVGFDRSVSLIRPRHTKIEITLLRLLEERFENLDETRKLYGNIDLLIQKLNEIKNDVLLGKEKRYIQI